MALSMHRFFRPRFSLWAMLVLITVVAIPLAYVAQRRNWNLRRLAFFEREGNLDSAFSCMTEARGLAATDASQALGRLLLLDSPEKLIRVWDGGINYGGLLEAEEADDFDDLNLSFTKRKLTDADLARLADFPELEDIQIHHADLITDEALAVVARLPHLKRLSIAQSPKITGDFLSRLSNSTLLEELQLQRMPAVRGESLENLRRFRQLQTLKLGEGICLTNESAARADLPASLKSLTLHKSEVGESTLVRWLGQCELDSLHLNTPLIGRVAKALRGQAKLKELTIINAALLDDDFLFLEAMPQLESLVVNGVSVKGKFLSAIKNPERLTSISLCNTLLTDENAAFLLRCPRLSSCDLSFTPITGEFLGEAEDWNESRYLKFVGVEFSNEGKAALAKLWSTKLVFLPMNWTESDFSLFARGEPLPYICEVGDAKVAEALQGRNHRVHYWSPEEWLTKIDRCSKDVMSPVIRLRELARQQKEDNQEMLPKEMVGAAASLIDQSPVSGNP